MLLTILVKSVLILGADLETSLFVFNVIIVDSINKHFADKGFLILETAVKVSSVCVLNGALAFYVTVLKFSSKDVAVGILQNSTFIVLEAF